MRHEKTVPGTPQHNGVAERMNRTIVEKVRCMLKMATLPKPFWDEAANTAVYLINRSPSIPLNFQIPEKAWMEKDVGYSHLRVFGCKAFMHVPKEQRSKLDDKAIPCIFVGYGDEEFGYRLWDLEKKKTVKSRDVVFHEHEKINDLKEDKATRSSGEGVEDLTPAKTPSRKITDEEEVQAPEDETEEPTIEEDEASVDGGNDEQGEQPLPQEEEPQLRRSTREHKPSARYPSSDYILITKEGEPKNFQEPEGFEEQGKEHMVCKLKKSLYELKQAPRQWYKKLDSFMMSHGYQRTNADPCVYIRLFPDGNFIILLLYVDDMLILGQDVEKICRLKEELSKSFDMKDLGPVKQILVSTPLANHFKLSKRSCPTTKEEKEKMSYIPYSSAIGSLMYAMVCTRPDIAHAVGVKCVALSTTEAEYIAATEAGKEMLWMKRFLQELGLKQKEYVVFCDSQSAIDLSKNTMYHARTKHIDLRYHWLCLVTENKQFQLKKIHTNNNDADMMTKVLPREKFEYCTKLARMNSK
ncbi:hypothetical protein SLEP1_g27844 [Rubroshorea leprosula]|uniref:Integrase catalytic domain-containing protein n=1 Tax=Rubroshorea leprosula TaxID=152421 RepID=A0AAV5K0F5_9ROSI|nr:hypothetical protein SLEP1_g27844 [Rubroshorea leprosula]